MNISWPMNIPRTYKRATGGYTLLEVLIGMVIFALGMMALMQLQGNLTKSSADSNARSVAVNIAEETIENARTFAQVTGGVGLNAFNNIVSGSATTSRGGINYTVARVVTNYYYQPPGTVNGSGTFTTTKPGNQVNPDMKMLQLTVSWGSGQTFQVDRTQAANLGSGSIVLTDMISSITSPSGGKVLTNSTAQQLYGPPVDYHPGQNPDIVSIQLGQNRFKESTKPEPKVYNANERVETQFDVVTYSQDNAGATFLRREEFLAVACECTLHVPSGSTQGGLRPTLWNGNSYTEGEFVSKAYGTSNRDNNTNYQSEYCGVCCSDHHDGGTGTKDDANDTPRSKYNPFRASSEYRTSADGATGLIGDHKHYRLGGITLANDGDTYYEACRLVRKDGFFRVAQDLRQEALNSFPASYLDDKSEVGVYSSYVTGAMALFKAAGVNNYEQSPPTFRTPLAMSPEVVFPGSKTSNRTALSVFVAASSPQQLRSRAIYVDYLTDELRTIISCLDGGGSGQTCGVGASNSALEILPFFDVQLTWLGRWNESPINAPVTVSNDAAIATGNTHDRGKARLTSGSGNSDITFKVNRGNLGLTGSDPIDGTYTANTRQYPMYALAVVAAPPPVVTGYNVTGTITSNVASVKASDVVIAASNGAACNRTLTGFECVVPVSGGSPRLTVSNYFKKNTTLVACSTTLATNGVPHTGTTVADNYTRFDLPQTGDVTGRNIYIKSGTSCP